jgi:hypothetical protein
MLRPSPAATADLASVFRSPSMRGLCPAPQRPALKSAMQFGMGPKFLLLSSAPASCGFMAETVGTRQGSPLRSDEREKPRP